MVSYLLRKVPSMLLVVFGASIIAFLLPRLAPGDPATVLAGPDASPDVVAAIRAQLGLDGSLPSQYWSWLGRALHGDFGASYTNNEPVLHLIGSRLGSTIELAVLATIIMTVVGVSLGVLGGSATARSHKWVRGVLDVVDSILLATPPFLTALLLIIAFGLAWPILPISGQVSILTDPWTGLQYLILPALALALPQAAVVARLIQTTMTRVSGESFVDLAISKGASPSRVTIRHVLRNSLGTAVIAIGLRIGELLGGAVIIEAIFARNGLGSLAISSVQTRDYLVIQTLVLLAVVVAMVIQLLSEVCLAALDPRVRLGT